MSEAKWTFWRPSRGAPRQDPTHTEHFTQDDLDGLTESLAREAIQNSLDEPASPDGRVHVRFAFSGVVNALPADRARHYLGSLESHLNACGIRVSDRDPVPYLLIEDFGTRGLTGDPSQSDDDPRAPGNFYYFWRNIGRTNKRASEGGTWGLGKAVYPAVSGVRSFFGLSVRDESPRGVLMGHSMLKTHGAWSPYGWYGHADGDFVLPIENGDTLRHFARDFRLARTEETGLSLVILRPDPDITPAAIATAVIRQYFLALVSGRLTVTVESPEGRYDIDRTSVDRLAAGLPVGASLVSWLNLSRAAVNPGLVIPVVNRKPDGAPRWDQCEIGHDDLPDLRRRFERGEVLAFTVPVTIRPVDAVPMNASLRVYLVKDASGRRERPLFVRGGILIPRATEDKIAGARLLGVVTDAPIASFVRDSENPSHTEWRRDSTHFRGRYDLGASTLAFLKQAPLQLWTRLSETAGERDPYALADLFHVSQPEERAGDGAAPDGRSADPHPAPPPPPVAQPLHIRRVEGGFVIAANAEATNLPASIELRTAYLIRDGARKALERWDPLDFQLERLRIDVQGANLERCEGNLLLLTGVTPQLRLTASGFDTLRDVLVKIVPREADDAAQT